MTGNDDNFQRLTELDVEFQSMRRRVRETEKLLDKAANQRRYLAVNELDQDLSELQTELKFIAVRKRSAYETFARDELSKLGERSPQELTRDNAAACATAIDAVVRGFILKLEDDLSKNNSTIDLLLALSEGMGLHDELRGVDNPRSPVKLRARKNEEHNCGIEIDGRVVDFVDRCQELEAFASAVSVAVSQSLRSAVRLLQQKVHDAASMNETEKPCGHCVTL